VRWQIQTSTLAVDSDLSGDEGEKKSDGSDEGKGAFHFSEQVVTLLIYWVRNARLFRQGRLQPTRPVVRKLVWFGGKRTPSRSPWNAQPTSQERTPRGMGCGIVVMDHDFTLKSEPFPSG